MHADVRFWSPAPVFCFAEADVSYSVGVDQEQTEAEDMNPDNTMAQDKQTMQYGLWPSPIRPQSLAEGLRLSEVALDSDGETLVWLEGRPDRGEVVCLPPGAEAPRDVTAELSVRPRVGYGGGACGVVRG